MIEIGESFGEHPRKPGPRLMRVGTVGPVRIEHDAMRLAEPMATQAREFAELMASTYAAVRAHEVASAKAHAKTRRLQRDRARRFAEAQLEIEAAANAAD